MGGVFQITTSRLILRPPRAEDLEAWVEMMADAQVTRFLGGQQPRSVAWRGFMAMAGSWFLTGVAMFCVIEKTSGRVIGRVGPWRPDGWPGPEIGWAIAREFWGRGFATEAAAAATEWVFTSLGWDEIIHCIDPANKASQAVATKLGSRNRGPGQLPPPYQDSIVDIWGQTREEWLMRAAK
jgi:RimJ/RimL family protein N-acetyltransferase